MVPALGIAGAAYATLIGYVVLLLIVVKLARATSLTGIYDWRRLGVLGGAAIVVYTGGVLTASRLDLTSFAIRACWFVAPFALAVALRRSSVLRLLNASN